MKRIQLFEFEDFSWFPDWLRTCMTNLIVLLQRGMGTPEVLADILERMIKEQGTEQIIDLGSGSGGAMPEVLRILRSRTGLQRTTLTLTDLFPNKMLVDRFSETEDNHLHYLGHPVDAVNMASAPEGIKTMINSFHHMPPEKARSILKSAQENHNPLLIYELGENNIPLVVWMLFLPFGLVFLIIMALFMTPFVRPMTWKQIIFTYLIPIIPICYAWDGQASLPRIYTFADMDILLKGLTTEEYSWEKGYAKNAKGKKKGIYLMGIPHFKRQ